MGGGLALGRRRLTSLRHGDLVMQLMELVMKKLFGAVGRIFQIMLYLEKSRDWIALVFAV